MTEIRALHTACRGLRVQRALLASSEGGSLYVDSVKSGRSRTAPLLPDVAALWIGGLLTGS